MRALIRVLDFLLANFLAAEFRGGRMVAVPARLDDVPLYALCQVY